MSMMKCDASVRVSLASSDDLSHESGKILAKQLPQLHEVAGVTLQRCTGGWVKGDHPLGVAYRPPVHVVGSIDSGSCSMGGRRPLTMLCLWWGGPRSACPTEALSLGVQWCGRCGESHGRASLTSSLSGRLHSHLKKAWEVGNL